MSGDKLTKQGVFVRLDKTKSRMQSEISGINGKKCGIKNGSREFGGTGQKMNRALYKMESGTFTHLRKSDRC